MLLRDWKNKNREYFFHHDINSIKKQKEWFAGYKKREEDHIFMIYWGKQLIGCIGFRVIDGIIDIYNAILGNRKFARKGIMSLALSLMCSYIVDNYDMEITLKVLKDNKAATSWYKSNGFTEKGAGDDHYHLRLDPGQFQYMDYRLE